MKKSKFFFIVIIGVLIVVSFNNYIDKDHTELSYTESTQLPKKVPYLRNEKPSASFNRFKETVARQANDFPNDYFLEALDCDKEVALTFDDGPDSKYTAEILDVLKKYKIKATFFLMGKNMERYPKLVQRINDEGHAIGNHSYDHPDLRKLSKDIAFQNQIAQTQEIFQRILGFEPTIFRPPYGAVTDEQIQFFAQEGLKTINWSIDTFDWDTKQNSAEEILSKVTTYMHEGAIILMHSGGGNRSNTVKSLSLIIQRLQNEGYAFKTIPEMLEINEYME